METPVMDLLSRALIRVYAGRERIAPVASVLTHLTEVWPGVRVELWPDLLVASLGRLDSGSWDHPAVATLATDVCRLRVLNPSQHIGPNSLPPMQPAVEYESRCLVGAVHAVRSIAYDAQQLQQLAAGLLPPARRGDEAPALWFTRRPLVEWDGARRRYRPCQFVPGRPSIISIGSIEQRLVWENRRNGARTSKGGQRVPPESPPRTTDVMKAYAMQAVQQPMAGDPVAENPRGRLSRPAVEGQRVSRVGA
jgi:hypothetical protein